MVSASAVTACSNRLAPARATQPVVVPGLQDSYVAATGQTPQKIYLCNKHLQELHRAQKGLKRDDAQNCGIPQAIVAVVALIATTIITIIALPFVALTGTAQTCCSGCR